VTQMGLQLTPREEQAANLARVEASIAGHVLEFCRGLLGKSRALSQDATFHMDELTSWVARKGCAAPDSAGRILRLLRQKGLVNYEVVSRSKSLYRVIEVSHD
jgi:hypothetical protein